MKHHTRLLFVTATVVFLLNSLAVGCANEVGADSATGGAPAPTEDKAIVGGSLSTIQQHPWQISLETLDGFHFCGGSIIAPDWVLTAQHCVTDNTAAQMMIVAGVTKLSQASQGQTIRVAEVIMDPGFRLAGLPMVVSLPPPTVVPCRGSIPSARRRGANRSMAVCVNPPNDSGVAMFSSRAPPAETASPGRKAEVKSAPFHANLRVSCPARSGSAPTRSISSIGRIPAIGSFENGNAMATAPINLPPM